MDTKGIRPGAPDLNRVRDNSKTEQAASQQVDLKKDSGFSKNFDVNLSDKAQQMLDAKNKALDIARSTPPIREDRIAAIKAQIADGSYQADSGKIADGIMVEAIKDAIAMKSDA